VVPVANSVYISHMLITAANEEQQVRLSYDTNVAVNYNSLVARCGATNPLTLLILNGC
jgi:hypothetical protein